MVIVRGLGGRGGRGGEGLATVEQDAGALTGAVRRGHETAAAHHGRQFGSELVRL